MRNPTTCWSRARAAAAFMVLLSDPRLGRVWLIEQAAAAVGYVVVTFVYGMAYGGLMAFVDCRTTRRLGGGTARAHEPPPFNENVIIGLR